MQFPDWPTISYQWLFSEWMNSSKLLTHLCVLGSYLLKDVHHGIQSSGGKFCLTSYVWTQLSYVCTKFPHFMYYYFFLMNLLVHVFLTYIRLCSIWWFCFSGSRFLRVLSLPTRWIWWLGNTVSFCKPFCLLMFICRIKKGCSISFYEPFLLFNTVKNSLYLLFDLWLDLKAFNSS